MKKNFLLLFLMALLPMAGWAVDNYEGANTILRFTATVDGDIRTAVIKGFVNGGDQANLVIPATVDFAIEDGAEPLEFKVVGIKADAFKDNEVITSVTFNGNLTTINAAFTGCKNLKTVNFTAATDLTTIAANAFKGTQITALDLSKTQVAEVNNLLGTTFTAPAVANATLTSVSLPKTVTSIVEKAFENCTALKDVTFEKADDAVTIGAAAFKGTAIETLDLSNTKVAEINNLFGTTYGDPAVVNATLKTVMLPVTWTTITESAFANCTALATISLYPGTGESATNQAINTLAFQGTALTALNFTKTNVRNIPAKLLIDGTIVKENNTLATVTLTDKFEANDNGLNGSFAACKALTAVNGLQSTAIVKLKASEFEGDKALTTINTSKITHFGNNAFKGCAALTAIDLAKATTLGTNTFEEAGLTTVTIPKTVAVIPDYCFYGCESLATVTFGHGAEDAFTSIGKYAFAYTKIAEITIPVAIPNAADAIDEIAFGGCENLKKFIMKPSVTTIDKKIVNDKAFVSCSDVIFYTTEDYVTANAVAPANSTYSIETPATVTTPFEPVKFKNEDKYYVKWVSATENIKIKKSDAKVYDAYLDDVNMTLDMVQFKTSGGYAYIKTGQVALIITEKADLGYEKQETGIGLPKSTSWVNPSEQVLKINGEPVERLVLESEAIDAGNLSLYAWSNSATKGTGFLKITSGKTIPAKTLYVFAKEEPAAAPGLRVVWHDEDGNIEKEETVTAIDDIIAAPVVKDGVMYNLQGVRVDNPTKKGIYIQNGKKYVVK